MMASNIVSNLFFNTNNIKLDNTCNKKSKVKYEWVRHTSVQVREVIIEIITMDVIQHSRNKGVIRLKLMKLQLRLIILPTINI